MTFEEWLAQTTLEGDTQEAHMKQAWDAAHKQSEITHACPLGDSNTTPCCDRTPWDLPMTDRMTLDLTLVNCPGATS